MQVFIEHMRSSKHHTYEQGDFLELDMQVSLAPSLVSPSVHSSYFWISILSAFSKRRDDIAVADMVADTAADMEVHMVASMEVDKVADKVADKKKTTKNPGRHGVGHGGRHGGYGVSSLK